MFVVNKRKQRNLALLKGHLESLPPVDRDLFGQEVDKGEKESSGATPAPRDCKGSDDLTSDLNPGQVVINRLDTSLQYTPSVVSSARRRRTTKAVERTYSSK